MANEFLSGSPPTHLLVRPYLIKKMFDLGYFGAAFWDEVVTVSDAQLQDAVKRYQAFHGMLPDGVVGPKTSTQLHRLRCALPDFEIRMSDQVCQWPMKRVTYFSQLALPGITPVQAIAAFDVATRQWNAICGIELVRVAEPQAANIVAASGSGRANGLDGPGGTLAWSELPCGAQTNSQYRQMFDEDESWNYNMAIAVICHEIGHAIGLPHLGKGNLMAPYYDPAVTLPQAGDKAEVVSRYGRATTPTPPAMPPAAADSLDVSGVISINGHPFVLVPR